MSIAKLPKDYRCPTCNAAPGEPCKRPSGHTIPFGDFHSGRKEMYSFFHGPGSAGVDSETIEEIDRADREVRSGQEALF